MSKYRRFGVTKDKTKNIIDWVINEAESGNVSKIQQEKMKIVCVPGKNSTEDKYIPIRDREYAKLAKKNGTKTMESLTLMNNKELLNLFGLAKRAVENRQKSGLLDVSYIEFNKSAKEIEKRVNKTTASQ